ncbi:MAG: hypothetical protein JNJ83_13275 [Verrucomicrobiaceae bacterium]|nr:hypothetical protein [Verrucomicrobiaceae bacterium]
MSGLVGHSIYGLLGLKEAQRRGSKVINAARLHLGSYLAGAYIGSDIQTMPEAICVETGREVGYGTVPLDKSPLTDGPVKPFTLATPEGQLSPKDVHTRFYGRAHLVFGWGLREKSLRVPWDHLADYFAAVWEDIHMLPGDLMRQQAYVLGWIAHVVGDSLIKSIQPGVQLKLLDGAYTPRNRPIQDLYAFHEVGVNELATDWLQLFRSMAESPVEAVQSHYMRCTHMSGHLGKLFPDGWLPESEATLKVVLKENRRWLAQHAKDVLSDMELTNGSCRASLRELAGLDYPEMKQLASDAGLRQVLDYIATEIASMIDAMEVRLKR